MSGPTELCETLTGNVDFACDYIAKHFEGVHVTKPEGTYMLFVDCTDWCAAHGKTIQDVEKACWAVGAAVQDGVMFHGPCHLRINLPRPAPALKRRSTGWTGMCSTQVISNNIYTAKGAVVLTSPSRLRRAGELSRQPLYFY